MSDAIDLTFVDPERELIHRAQGGDESAFEEIVRAHCERIFRHVVAMVRNEHDARECDRCSSSQASGRVGTSRPSGHPARILDAERDRVLGSIEQGTQDF